MIQYILFSTLILGASTGLFWLWRRRILREITEGAQVEYQHLKSTHPDLLGTLDEAEFAVIYHRTEYPRFPIYALASVAIFLIGSPIIMGLLSAGAFYALQLGIIAQPGDAATNLYLGADSASIVRKVTPETLSYILQGWAGFYYFLGLLAFWITAVYFTMRHYHSRTPGTVRQEILRGR